MRRERGWGTLCAILIVMVVWAAAMFFGSRAGAAPAADYRAQDWFVDMNTITCQDATVGGPMPHNAAVQVLIYPADSSQPAYAHVFFNQIGTFSGTIHLAKPMARWYVVELTYEGAPWLMYSAEADCYASPLKSGP